MRLAIVKMRGKKKLPDTIHLPSGKVDLAMIKVYLEMMFKASSGSDPRQ